MPTFDFTAPDGKSYSVDGPDGATPEQAFQILQQHLAPAPQDAPGVGSDLLGVAKSAPGRIVTGLAGLPADIAHLYASDQNAPNPLGSEGLRKAADPYIGGAYEAKTGLGKVAQTGVDFAPALIGGPETMLAKLATRVAAPAIASEAAGKLTEGTAAEPYAKVAGALLGAGGASMAANRLRAAAARGAAEVPTVAELKTAARGDYNHADVADVRIAPAAAARLADTIESDLQFGPNSGFRPTNAAHAPVFDEVANLRAGAAQGAAAGPMPKTVADLDNVRQGLGNLAKERDAAGQFTPAAAAAQRAIGHIDNFLPNLQQGDLLAGDAARANTILQRARANWGAAKRAESVQTLAANAEINAASANSGANIQNATKQAFKPMLKNNAAKAVGYNDEELAALNQIVRGTWAGSAARAAGNLLGGGGGLGMLASGAVGYHEGGVGGAIAAGLAGRGLKMIGNRSTFNAVQRLDSLIRSRSPEAIRIAAQNPQYARVLPSRSVQILRTMILSEPAFRGPENQNRQPVGQARAQ